MTKYNPTGLNRMNMNGMSEDAFIEHAKRAKYLSAVCIDALHMNRRLNEEAGVLYSIARIYGFDPRPDNDNPSHVRAYAEARYQDLKNLRRDARTPNLHYYIQNERGFEKRDFMMFCELLKLSVADKEGVIGLVFWNGASGAVMTGFWGQPNQWSEPYAIEFLKLMHKHRNVRLPSGAYAFILSGHGYTSQYPLIAVNAGRDRKKKGDSRNLWQTHQDYLDGTKHVDWRLAQDHLCRDYQGIMRALGYEPVNEGRRFAPTDDTLLDENEQYIMCPWLLPTEAGLDNMNDVSGVHGDELQPMAAHVAVPIDDEIVPMTRMEELKVGRYGWRLWLLTLAEWLEKLWLAFVGAFIALAAFSPRGYRSLAKTWQQASWFPGKSAGYTFAWQMVWEWKALQSMTEVTIAQIVFCEGQTSPQWGSYNTNGDTDYKEFMESDDAKTEIADHFIRPVMSPPPPPPPPVVIPPLIDVAPTDSRFGTDRWKCIVDSMNSPVNIRKQPDVTAESVGQLFATQAPIEVSHIPHNALTAAEQDAVTDNEGRRWSVLKHDSFGVCYVASEFVRLEKIPPPFESRMIEESRYQELIQKEKDYTLLQMKLLANVGTGSQISIKLERVGKAYDEAAQLLQGSTGDLNDAVEWLLKITNGETLQ